MAEPDGVGVPREVTNVAKGRDLEEIAICAVYTNWKGETSERRFVPLEIYYGNLKPYHEQMQWLLKGWDMEKKDYRHYALAGIKKWVRVPLGGS
ncbi:WYL domain-containing protein [Candidatus Pacearchaeota archaeon]|nr:WYL domain-containing protein [Candidatus Pacearchaeota archaeon]